jgi:MFS family permease
VTRWRIGLAAVLLLALGLRLWGIRYGLPYVYNSDESSHFVPRAVRFFDEGYNPHYFRNPPGFTYFVHVVLALWFLGRDAVADFAHDPSEAFTVARVATALLGTAVVGIVYAIGARLFDRRAGLLAAALMAVAFLPVFYSHLALNDVPATLPLAVSLLGSVGIFLRGRLLDHAIAGLGLGFGAATKYTAGIALVSLLAAVAIQLWTSTERRRTLAGLGVAAAASIGAFVIANPYALVDFHEFHRGLTIQSRLAGRHKLGLTEESPLRYYLWSATWGLGWVPAIAAVAGAVLLVVRKQAAALLLLPAPAVFLLYMATQERYFGRWLLPLFPFACILAGYAVVAGADAIGRRWPRFLAPALGVATVALTAQGLVYAVHNDLVLSRTDTRTFARAWMVEHIPAGSQIVLEPAFPLRWLKDDGHALWRRNTVNRAGEGYARRLRPSFIDEYVADGACWVVRASTVSGRAFAEPERVPKSIDYYRELDRRGQVAFHMSPYGDDPVPFNFDWSFDYYPRAYDRPGPEVTIYRLGGPGCG